VEKVHIHLGDGSFVGSYSGRSDLEPATAYVLRVRFQDSSAAAGPYAQRPFGTYPASSPGGTTPWTPVQPGYRIETVAGGLQLPLDIAFAPASQGRPRDPLLYLTELYGRIVVVTRAGAVRTYADGLLDFDPTGDFPG